MNPLKNKLGFSPIEEEEDENQDNLQEGLAESKIEEENLSAEQLEAKYSENPYSLETIILLLEVYKETNQTSKLQVLRKDVHESFLLPEG